jgi:CRP-like cAMP-binding protein
MIDALRRFDLLAECSGEDLSAIAEVLEERQYDAGEALFRAEDEASELLLVIDGRVRIELEGQVLGELGAGEAIGAASLVSIGTRACDVVAVEPTVVRVLSREGYHRLRSDRPPAALALQEGTLRGMAGLVRVSVRDRRGSSSQSGATDG